MHVAPADFRSVRYGAITIRFAVLGDVAYVLADLPDGSAGTVLEERCEREHWGFVVDGAINLVVGRRRASVPTGTAFHVSGGTRHRLFAEPGTRLAGFAAIEPGRDISDAGLRADGFEILPAAVGLRPPTVPVVAPPDGRTPPRGGIVGVSSLMGERVFTRAVLGPRSGFTGGWCDLAHWGLVTAGAMAIEWEDDVEVLSAGDVYFCPPGPPGHRFEAADGATVIDFTPEAGLRAGARAALWRQEAYLAIAGPSPAPDGHPLAIAALG